MGGEDWLFAEHDLGAVLRADIDHVRALVDGIPDEEFRSRSDDELLRAILSDHRTLPLELDEALKSMSTRAVTVNIQHNPRFFTMPGHRPEVPGTEVRITIPYKGDFLLWRCQPNRWKSVHPRGQVHEGRPRGREGTLDLVFTRPGEIDAEAIKRELESALDLIRFYVDAQRQQIAQEQAGLAGAVERAITDRRARQKGIIDLAALIGIPMAQKPEPTPARADTERPVASRARGHMSQKWDAFISHASEDKVDFVRPLAEVLNERGVRVWYDEFTLTVGDSLRRKIDEGLARSTFGIVVLSPAFFAKEWTQRELDGLVAREIEGKKVILPIWHNVSVKDVRRHSPTLAD